MKKNYKKYCDVVNISQCVKSGYIRFYIQSSYIYCENMLTKERVVVKTLVTDPERLLVAVLKKLNIKNLELSFSDLEAAFKGDTYRSDYLLKKEIVKITRHKSDFL